MTWELEADFDTDSPERLAQALCGWFGEDLVGIRLHRWRGDDQADFGSQDLFPGDSVDLNVAPDERLELSLWLADATSLPYEPLPTITVFGPSLRGMGRIRARAPVVLGLGNRKAWAGARLPTGRPLTEAAVIELLLHLCRTGLPRSARLVPEAQVSLAINDLFVYHHSPDGFLRDLRDLAQLVLRGGDGRFGDARDDYAPLSRKGNSLLMCGRPVPWQETLSKALIARLQIMEEVGWPATLSTDTLETALAGLEDDVDFAQWNAGAAVWGTPPVRNHVDLFIIGLLDALLEN